MYISTLATAMLSLAGIARAVAIDKSACENGPWAEPVRAGPWWTEMDENTYFCEGGHVFGEVLTGIRIWRGDWGVFGLQFQWSYKDFGGMYGTGEDGRGNKRAPDQELKWKVTDEVEIHMKDNHGKEKLDAVGWIKVIINGQVMMDHGSHHTGNWILPDAGSRRIIALQGKAVSQAGVKGNTPVGIIQFMYLESKIRSATMTSVTLTESLDKWNSEQKGIEPDVSIGSIWFVNENEEGGLNQTFTVTDQATWTDEKTFTNTMGSSTTVSLDVSVGVSAGVPELFSAETSISMGAEFGTTQEVSEEHKSSTAQSISFTAGSDTLGVPPQHATLCTARATKGTYDSPYVAEITALLENGKKYVFREEGEYKSITYVDAKASCKTMPLKDMTKEGGAADGAIKKTAGEDISAKQRRGYTLFRPESGTTGTGAGRHA